MLQAYLSDCPEVASGSYVHKMSCVIGNVVIDKCVMVAPFASIRADEASPIKICKRANVQDHVTIHGLEDRFVKVEGRHYSVWIGAYCTLAHGSIVHGPAKISQKTFVGFKAIVHNAEVGERCYIDMGAIVRNVVIADGKYVPCNTVVETPEQAESLPNCIDKHHEFSREVVSVNQALAIEHLASSAA